MKKFLLLVLTLVLIFTVCACGSKEVEEEPSSMPDLSAVDPTPTPTPPPVEVQVVISGRGVNVRAEANTDCEIYGNVINEAFYLIEDAGDSDFHKILYEGKEAYIFADYCEVKTMTEAEAEALIEGIPLTTESETEPETNEDESTVSVNSEDGQRR